MLIVVKYGNVKKLLQPFFNFKTSGCTDILQIDASESRSDIDDCADNFIRILCIKADRDCIDAAKFLEKDGLAFHDRHGG